MTVPTGGAIVLFGSWVQLYPSQEYPGPQPLRADAGLAEAARTAIPIRASEPKRIFVILSIPRRRSSNLKMNGEQIRVGINVTCLRVDLLSLTGVEVFILR